ncbi:WD40 repeat-like protein [Trametopsis cervina]|nr:WD40 repeat-like protein [Trametopsis cervina]
MPPARRRVSYIIPPPSGPVKRLKLPPHGTSRRGATGPLLVPYEHDGSHEVEYALPQCAQHPRHRLGVSCLALDTSTQLLGRDNPEGILYTGGRDGLVLSWDLGIALKRRSRRYGLSDNQPLRRPVGRWEIMTGWAEDIIEEDGEDDEYRSDGDILGDVQGNGVRGRRRQPTNINEIPYEDQWEVDAGLLQPGKMSQFRQSVQAHTDWVNDVLLCNYNQTLVSASSDGTIKAWSPHTTEPTEPTTVGTHGDYARCLARSRDPQWVASGSFDRTIKLWDLQRENQDPLVTLHSPESSGAKSSVYALTADPYGTLIASGSPERVVRMWDPRSGKRIGKLMGHTDNIRAICISEDAKYLLTGSADASVKLWSLATQKCLHTFTHHTDSVWSLASSHPSLEIFYSGDRSGIVCKVDVEGCTDVSEGECVVLVQDSDNRSSADGVNKIAVMDDKLLWTATGSSSIKRWHVPGSRSSRTTASEQDISGSSFLESSSVSRRSPTSGLTPERHSSSPSPSHYDNIRRNSDMENVGDVDREGEDTWYGIPFDSLVKLTSPNDGFSGFGAARGRDPEIATLYSAASVMSVPRLVRSPLSSVFQNTGNPSPTTMIPRSMSPIPSESMHPRSHAEETIHPLKTARADFEERELASDAVPLNSVPDEIIHGNPGLVRCAMLNDRVHALTVDTTGEVAVWDLARCSCLGRFTCEDIADASLGSSRSEGSNEHELDRSPREAIETVKERIEGEAAVASWAAIDTKTGLLTVHINDRCFEAEIYADEAGFGPDRHFNDEMRINVGKWVLRNLFIHFIRDQHRAATRRSRETSNTDGHGHRIHRGGAPQHVDISTSPDLRPRSLSDASRRSLQGVKSATVVSSNDMVPAVAPNVGPSSIRSSPLLTPMIPLAVSGRESTLSPIPQSPLSTDATPMPRRPTTSETGTVRTGDYFSLRTRRPSVSTSTPAVPPSPDDFSSWGTSNGLTPATPTTPGGGLMGRLKAFGKGTKRLASEGAGAVGTTPSLDSGIGSNDSSLPSKTPLQTLLSSPLNPPMSNEAPTINLPPHTSILISEESTSGWSTLYSGQVSSTGHDARLLEDAMPLWLLEYLLINKIPVPPAVKISFVLLPWRSDNPNEKSLPELLNTTQSKLTASRFLRVRKLTQHVQDKLEKITASRPATAASTPRSSLDARSLKSQSRSANADPEHHPLHPKAEDKYEILCDSAILPLNMTLAAVRQYVWRSSEELIMYYRQKTPSA